MKALLNSGTAAEYYELCDQLAGKFTRTVVELCF